MKVFVIDRSPNGGNGNIATLRMDSLPNVGDQLMISDTECNRREYVVRGRRFVVRQKHVRMRVRKGEWRDVIKDVVTGTALFVVSQEAFAKELQSVERTSG